MERRAALMASLRRSEAVVRGHFAGRILARAPKLTCGANADASMHGT